MRTALQMAAAYRHVQYVSSQLPGLPPLSTAWYQSPVFALRVYRSISSACSTVTSESPGRLRSAAHCAMNGPAMYSASSQIWSRLMALCRKPPMSVLGKRSKNHRTVSFALLQRASPVLLLLRKQQHARMQIVQLTRVEA